MLGDGVSDGVREGLGLGSRVGEPEEDGRVACRGAASLTGSLPPEPLLSAAQAMMPTSSSTAAPTSHVARPGRHRPPPAAAGGRRGADARRGRRGSPIGSWSTTGGTAPANRWVSLGSSATASGTVEVGAGRTTVPAGPVRRKSRTCVIVQRCAGSRVIVASSSGVSQPASASRGGSSWTIR